MKTVLAPIDFSPISRRVLDEGAAIARAIGGRLVLLNVVQPPTGLSHEFAETDVSTGFFLHAESDSAAKLAKLQKELRDEGVTAHVVHQVGSSGMQIIEQAERLDADYIVMGSHGHGALYDLIVRSTTNRVLKQAACPVIIVPPATRKPRQVKEPVVEQSQPVEV